MPGENGFALLNQVRALPATAGGLVPVIALTAYSRAEHRQAAMSAGFAQYLTKPIDFEAVIAAVTREGRRTTRQG